MRKKIAQIFVIMSFIILGYFYLPSLAAAEVKEVKKEDGILRKADLLESKEVELNEIKGQILQYVKNIKFKEQEIEELNRVLQEIQQQIDSLNKSIEETQKNIQRTESEIQHYQELIVQEESTIKHQKVLIAQYVREMYELEDLSMLQVTLGKKRISDFLNREESVEQIQKSINEAMQEVKERKFNLEKIKTDLEMKKQEQNDLRALQEVQKITLTEKSKEQTFFLESTKNEKIRFEKLLNDSRERFNSVRKEIRLIGGSEALTFEDALRYAESVEIKTGVRRAFILAILKQESNWGQNTGTSLYLDALSGCVNGKKDQYNDRYEGALALAQKREAIFIKIITELNLPETTLVSACPRSYLGTGGALGPAQFMPDTWLGYKEDLAALKGGLPSPFDIQDAMLAMGLKMANAGANAKTPEAEWKAAMIYFAGGNWDNPSFSFYGDSVMNLAKAYQDEIDKVQVPQ